MGQFQFSYWLVYWYLHSDRFSFDWDRGNLRKSELKHAVSTREVEAVFTGRRSIPIGRQVAPTTPEDRFCLVGPTDEGRLISVVFTVRNDRIRAISARTASRKERNLYEKVRKSLEGV